MIGVCRHRRRRRCRDGFGFDRPGLRRRGGGGGDGRGALTCRFALRCRERVAAEVGVGVGWSTTRQASRRRWRHGGIGHRQPGRGAECRCSQAATNPMRSRCPSSPPVAVSRVSRVWHCSSRLGLLLRLTVRQLFIIRRSRSSGPQIPCRCPGQPPRQHATASLAEHMRHPSLDRCMPAAAALLCPAREQFSPSTSIALHLHTPVEWPDAERS